MTRLCVPITAFTCEAMLRDAHAAIAAGADMIELRLDYLDLSTEYGHLLPALESLKEFADRIIVTCRIFAEGGRFHGDEAKRAEIFDIASAGLGFVNYMDIEYARWDALPERLLKLFTSLNDVFDELESKRLNLILSRHDFEATPNELSPMISELANTKGDVIKIATKANSITDSVRMLDALREWSNKRATIALTMGETSVLTRVLAKKFGAFLTFASLDAGKESAPGQLTLKDMRETYRWDTINAQTKVYGVIGCPVGHSMSPHILNAAFGAIGHDGVYLHLRVEPAYEAFSEFMDACLARPWLDLSGCSVTIPHKENLLRYVREHGGYIEPLAARIGVANTLVINQRAAGFSPRGDTNAENALLNAYNTDYRGALDALCNGLNCTPDELKRYTFAVLGAGGAARAIVVGLRDAGCTVDIYNRTADKAQALADEFGGIAKPWETREKIAADVIINCTSIGMWPNVQETPLPDLKITPQTTVFDTIANPVESRLLREARERGCRTINGVSMFVNQAAAQFELWTGKPAPKELMREVVLSRTRS